MSKKMIGCGVGCPGCGGTCGALGCCAVGAMTYGGYAGPPSGKIGPGTSVARMIRDGAGARLGLSDDELETIQSILQAGANVTSAAREKQRVEESFVDKYGVALVAAGVLAVIVGPAWINALRKRR